MSAKIAKSIVEPIMKSGFDGIFIAISNPVDIIAHYIYKLSGLPKNQVIGTGTAIDSARLQNMIAHGGTWRFPDGAVVYGYDRRKTVL